MAISNGVPASELPGVVWLKARASIGIGECVELAHVTEGAVAVRNSRHPQGPVLIFTKAELRAFLRAAKDSEFDHLAEG